MRRLVGRQERERDLRDVVLFAPETRPERRVDERFDRVGVGRSRERRAAAALRVRDVPREMGADFRRDGRARGIRRSAHGRRRADQARRAADLGPWRRAIAGTARHARAAGSAPWPPVAAAALVERRRLRSRLVVEVRQRHARQPAADRLLDGAQAALFLRRHQRERRAGRFGARRAADAVDVVLGHQRHVEVDDVAERGDVDAARRDVGGDQHPVLAALEAGERFGPLRLRPVAVNALDLDPLFAEILRQPVGAVLGPREDERVVHLAARQQLQQQRRLQMLRHRIDGVRDPDGRRRSPLDVDGRRRS